MEQSEEKEEKEIWCCMCGDVGFSDQLRRCPNCHSRLQHTYCSRMYPDISMSSWQCEWCLHENRNQKQEQQQNTAITNAKLIKKRHRDHKEEMTGERKALVNTVNPKKQHQQKDEPSSLMPSLKTQDGNRLRKPRCNLTSPRVVGRRYKLLADVLY